MDLKRWNRVGIEFLGSLSTGSRMTSNNSFRDKLHINIESSFYYHESKVYPPNTVVTLFTAPLSFDTESTKLFCKSVDNSTDELLSKLSIKHAYYPHGMCGHTTFIAHCQSPQHPLSIRITDEDEGLKVPLPLELPETQKHPVVVCFSPLFMFENYQLLATTVEIYKFFGADLQVFYLMSVLTGVYDLLKAYEGKNTVRINPWTLPRANSVKNGLEYRDQATAHNHCLLKHQNSADFVLFADIDDVLIPKHSSNYLDEFKLYSEKYPQFTSFLIERKVVHVDVGKITNLEQFELISVIKNSAIDRGASALTGKSVHKTQNVTSAWIHYVFEDKKIGEKTQLIGVNDSNFLHLKFNNTFDAATGNTPEYLTANKSSMASILTKTQATSVNAAFNSTKSHYLKSHAAINTTDHYSSQVTKCYQHMTERVAPCFNVLTRILSKLQNCCYTVTRCRFDPIQNVACLMSTPPKTRAIHKGQFIYNVKSRQGTDHETFFVNKHGCHVL